MNTLEIKLRNKLVWVVIGLGIFIMLISGLTAFFWDTTVDGMRKWWFLGGVAVFDSHSKI